MYRIQSFMCLKDRDVKYIECQTLVSLVRLMQHNVPGIPT